MKCPLSYSDLEAEQGLSPTVRAMKSVLGLDPPLALASFEEVHNMPEPQFSHLKVGIITATSQESCDERENRAWHHAQE